MKDDILLPARVRPLPDGFPSADLRSGNYSQGNEEVQLREYFRIVFKYRIYIFAILILSVVLSAVYAFTVTPLYTATSKIRIATYEPMLMATRVEDVLQEKSKEATYLETQIQELKSFSLADKVLEDPQLRDIVQGKKEGGGLFSWLFGVGAGDAAGEPEKGSTSNEAVGGYKTPFSLIRRYLAVIDVQPIRRTALVTINARWKDPVIAAEMANRHASSYIDWVRTARVDQQSRGLKFLRSQSEELKEKVADLEREIADYAEANSIVAINKDENITAQKMSQLNKLLTDSTAKRIELENQWKEAESALQGSGAGFEDSTTQGMRSQLSQLEAEYQQLSAKFMPGYPRMQQLSAQIAGIKDGLKKQRSQIVTGMKSKALAAAEEEKRLKEELEQQTSQAFELSKRQVQFNILNRELTTSRDLLQNILKQIKETSLSVESNATNVSIVDAAVVPMEPSYPRKRLVVLAGIGIGVALSLVLVFLLNYLDNSVRTPEDVNQLLKVACLGVVPSFDLHTLSAPGNRGSGSSRSSSSSLVPRPEEGGSTLPVVYLRDPKSLASEAYRTIRTGILLSQAGEPPKTILVTSAQSSEGKTTSCVNLAASLASAGGRVVVLDADLRRPSLNKYFNLPQDIPGLVDLITGQAAIHEVGRSDLVRRITVIPSGRIPPNPAELLGSLEMASILDQLAEQYDYVLIDSPPILPVTDSVILSRYVDGVVIVVKGATTPRRVVRDARDRLAAVGARFLGVVLNDVDITGGDYYYYNRYYHSYYAESVDEKRGKVAS